MIESVQYTDENNGVVQAIIDGLSYSIPVNTGNRHWQMIINWMASDPENNVIATYQPPARIPHSQLLEFTRTDLENF